jgi:hypothetical protein
MKNFIKNYGPGLINISMLVISLIVGLSANPGIAITAGEYGWAIVRGIVLLWSVFMAVGTYSKWIFIGKGLKELFNKFMNVKTPKTSDRKWVHSMFGKTSLNMWVACWIVVWQIIAIFYVASWCTSGF